MRYNRRHAVGMLAMMVASSGMAYVATPRIKIADLGPKVDLEAMFPQSFGDWSVDTTMPVILPAPDLQAKLDAIYNQVLARTYVNKSGYRVMLSVAYGGDQSDGTSVHRPEVCYPAQGFQILDNRKVTLNIGGREVQARVLNSRMGQRYEPILYWMVIGDRTATTSLELKLAQVRFGLHGRIPDGLLLRASSIDREPAAALEQQLEFWRQMSNHLDPARQARVFGGVGAATAAFSSSAIKSGA